MCAGRASFDTRRRAGGRRSEFLRITNAISVLFLSSRGARFPGWMSDDACLWVEEKEKNASKSSKREEGHMRKQGVGLALRYIAVSGLPSVER